MPSEPKQSIPTKCDHCHRQMSEVVVCDYCHALSPSGLMTDYFTLLGLPRHYDLDEDDLRQKFFALNRHAHPDQHGGESPEVQQLSLALSAAINDAYRTLKDPASRGAYLLELLGGQSSAGDKSVPENLLNTVMMMQEELVDAKSAGDAAAVARIRETMTNQHDGLLRRVATLFSQIEDASACQAIRSDLLSEIRKQLNAISYVKKLLSQAG
ncbi:MAG: Fe-S protein assembly co-chaperone HscB [Planctomycetaceae bacterium]|nr:MAG: Fe-S protein assembly co-chaperone HscB [Planctomycetaceae bacterium]